MSESPDLDRVAREGTARLERSTVSLLATGLMGGIDVSLGILALFAVTETLGSHLLASLGFSVGFVVLTLAGSELFTENFLVPVAAVTAGHAPASSIARLWGGTLVCNLLGGWLLVLILMSAFPDLRPVAVDIGHHFVELEIGLRSFSLAVLAGGIITLMTWMELAGSAGIRVVAAVIAGSLLALGEMNHVIVASLEMFAGLIVGAPYGYGDWLRVFAWAALGNLVGGLGLVTVLRLAKIHSSES